MWSFSIGSGSGVQQPFISVSQGPCCLLLCYKSQHGSARFIRVQTCEGKQPHFVVAPLGHGSARFSTVQQGSDLRRKTATFCCSSLGSRFSTVQQGSDLRRKTATCCCRPHWVTVQQGSARFSRVQTCEENQPRSVVAPLGHGSARFSRAQTCEEKNSHILL